MDDSVVWHRRIIWTIPVGKLTPQMASMGALSCFVDRLGVNTELENLASASLKVLREILSSERVSLGDWRSDQNHFLAVLLLESCGEMLSTF